MASNLTDILEWIDPEALPPNIRKWLTEIGPGLVLGLCYREIAERLSPPRSSDYVAVKVRMIREALVAEALTRADAMGVALRERLEELSPCTVSR